MYSRPLPPEENLREQGSCTQAKKVIANIARQSILIFQILYSMGIIAFVTAERRNLEDFQMMEQKIIPEVNR